MVVPGPSHDPRVQFSALEAARSPRRQVPHDFYRDYEDNFDKDDEFDEYDEPPLEELPERWSSWAVLEEPWCILYEGNNPHSLLNRASRDVVAWLWVQTKKDSLGVVYFAINPLATVNM